MWKVLAKVDSGGKPPYTAWREEEIAPPEWDPKPVYEGTREECLKWIRDHSKPAAKKNAIKKSAAKKPAKKKAVKKSAAKKPAKKKAVKKSAAKKPAKKKAVKKSAAKKPAKKKAVKKPPAKKRAEEPAKAAESENQA